MIDVLDMHTHTLASGHAYSTIQEMAAQAKAAGLSVLGITDHAPEMPGTCHEYYFANLKVVPRVIGGQHLLFGSELNIMDKKGTVDLEERILETLDFCVASIHPPCFQSERNSRDVTNAYLEACENSYVTIIGHPDDGRFPVDYESLVIKARDTRTLLELNNASLTPGGFRLNCRENAKLMLHFCEKYGAQVIMDSDAHVFSQVGDHRYPKDIIEEMHFPEELVINRSLDEFTKFLLKNPVWM